jgi:hypothetical protein
MHPLVLHAAGGSIDSPAVTTLDHHFGTSDTSVDCKPSSE